MFCPFKFFIFLANYLLRPRIKFIGGAHPSLSLEHFHFPLKSQMRHLSARIHMRLFPPPAKFCDNELEQLAKSTSAQIKKLSFHYLYSSPSLKKFIYMFK